MGAPQGNNNPAKGAYLKSVIKKRLEERRALDSIVDKMIEQAMEGDKDARRDIFDRVAGKPAQSLELSGADGDAIQLEKIERVIVNPKN